MEEANSVLSTFILYIIILNILYNMIFDNRWGTFTGRHLIIVHLIVYNTIIPIRIKFIHSYTIIIYGNMR